jgi:transcriptional regulator with XRE-family HTH domain
MGISKNTIHDYEQGKRYPSVEFIYDYCDVLGLPVDEVLNEWLRCHPKENIRDHSQLTLEKYYYHNLSSSYKTKERSDARDFLTRALAYSFIQNGIADFDVEQLVNISRSMAEIIDTTLAQGLRLEPENIHMCKQYSLHENIDKLNF